MDVTSSRAGEQLQPTARGAQTAPGASGSLSLVNVGISHQTQLPTGSEAWNPDPEVSPKKQGYFLECEVYRNDVLVKFDRTSIAPPEGCKRGEVTAPSRESLNRCFLTINNANVEFKSFATNTVHQAVWKYFRAEDFKQVHNLYLIRAKRLGWGDEYAWVREFQENGAPHYHALHSFECDQTFTYFDARGCERTVDLERSRALSIWYTDQLASRFRFCEECRSGGYVACAAKNRFCGEAFRKMAYPRTNAGGFMGCCRLELIRATDNVGGYISKELSKRLQKEPPQGWTGRFWGTSRGVKAVPIKTMYLHSDTLASRLVETEIGALEMVTKLQYGLGKRILQKSSTVEPFQNGGE